MKGRGAQGITPTSKKVQSNSMSCVAWQKNGTEALLRDMRQMLFALAWPRRKRRKTRVGVGVGVGVRGPLRSS